MSIADIRKEYRHASLSESDAASDPLDQFTLWFEEASRAKLPELNAMSLATVDENGRPSSRIVLIKGFDQRGFTWYTNYESRKGRHLNTTPYAALLFHWVELERQVAIEGRVERVSAAESDAYFASRPFESQLGAIASDQSEPIADRQMLDAKLTEAQATYSQSPPRPPHWGGFRLVPSRFEFWQGRSSRLHDRLLYTLVDGQWKRHRLQP